ncbi:MAG: ANTAR domain-containing protein [Lachnospiraceae bacterium]|nr:ANTAR domain-containing protein [Lachnospiraceae bacterium]
MGSVLIVMPKSEDAYHIARSLSERGQMLDTEVCLNAADVLRISHDRDYGVVICTRQLKDMSYMELAGYLPEYFGMIVLTRDPELDTYADNIIKLMMPFKTSELLSTIDMITSVFIRRIRKKGNIPIKRSRSQNQVVEDAKRLLMERNAMSEPEAFRYIQKTSMDTGRTMVESAQMILMIG